MSLKVFILLALVCTAFAVHTGHRLGGHRCRDSFGERGCTKHHEEEAENDDEEEEEEEESDDDDAEVLLPASSSRRDSRRVIWSGPSSYPGYRRRTSVSTSSRRQAPPVPARTYRQSRDSRDRRQTPRPQRVRVPLYNRRANDPTYRQGLRELADLM